MLKFLAVISVAAALAVLPFASVNASSLAVKYPQSLTPKEVTLAQAKVACMPCRDKCPKCIHTGRFPSVAACIADCKAKHTSGKNKGKGTQPVVAQCGVPKPCPN